MSAQPYMQLWIADFLGDTLHLTDAEIGQYMLLLMAMWRNDGHLPADPQKLARIARNPVSDAVMALFQQCNGNAGALLTQKRLCAELERANARRNAASGNAKARWLKNNKPDDAIALRPQCNGNANQNQNHSLPIGREKSSRAKRGTSLPPDWKPSCADVAWADERGYPLPWQRDQFEQMRLWAQANANRAVARKADWSATWRNWLKRAWDERRGTGPPGERKTRTRQAIEEFLHD